MLEKNRSFIDVAVGHIPVSKIHIRQYSECSSFWSALKIAILNFSRLIVTVGVQVGIPRTGHLDKCGELERKPTDVISCASSNCSGAVTPRVC